MSATEAEHIRRVVANVLAKERAANGEPLITPEEAEDAALLALARASRRR